MTERLLDFFGLPFGDTVHVHQLNLMKHIEDTGAPLYIDVPHDSTIVGCINDYENIEEPLIERLKEKNRVNDSDSSKKKYEVFHSSIHFCYLSLGNKLKQFNLKPTTER
jgi:hypothetical protein